MNPPFQAAIGKLLPEEGEDFAFALSGGPDSLALLNALKDHPRLKAVFHVDHGLRNESADEARRVRALAHSLGHDLTVLTWSPGDISSGIQEKARRARYGLMGDACRLRGLSRLVTAHHADDQAETVLMRLQRGSGWRGAAGMKPESYAPVWPELAGVTLVRPALNVSRLELRAQLGDLVPIMDASNVDRRFRRVRARAELAATPDLRSNMLTLAQDMRSGRSVEMGKIARELAGFHLTHEGLFTVPRLLSAVSLALLAPIIGGRSGPADRRRLRKQMQTIENGETVTIGCGTLARWSGDVLTLSRDPVAMLGRRDGSLAPTAVRAEIGPEAMIWDGRFLLQGEGGIIQPERRGHHVGYRVLYGRDVRIVNLVEQRLQAALTGM